MTESSSRHDTNQVPRVNLEGTSGSKRDQVQIPHDSPLSGGQTSSRAEGALNLDELFVLCTNLSNRVLALETFKDAQDTEILTLKTRIKKLEKKSKLVISHHRAWFRSVLSTFDDLDEYLAHGMDYMETEEALDKGRTSSKTEKLNVTNDNVDIEKKGSGEKGGSIENPVSTAVPEVSTVNVSTTSRPEVSTAAPMTPPTTTSVFEDEDIFLDDALVMLSDKTKLKGVVIKETKESDKPARSILTLKPLPIIDPKDKGKGVLEEPELTKKMTKSDFDVALVARDEEVARQLEVEWKAEGEKEKQRQEQASMDYIANLYDEVQARIDADHELAVKWTHEEQEKYTVNERAKLLAEFFKRRKKQLAEERVAAIRNKPPTRTQLALYIKEQERAAHFVPIGSEEDERQIQKMNKKTTKVYKEKVLEEPDSTKIEDINKKAEGENSDKGMDSTKKRKAGSRMKRMSKRQKTDADLEEEEQLKAFLNIVSDEEGEVDYEVLDKRVFRADGSSRYIKTFTEMVSRFDRLDFIELHSLVMQRFAITTPEGIDLVLWGDLRTMFEENADDDLWKNQEEWILKSWNFYENCRVHVLVLEDGTEFYMLAERRYPLTKETLKRMLTLRLIADSESEAVFYLLRFVQKQIDEFGSHDGICQKLYGSQLTMLHSKKLASPKQTALGKDISNPLIVDSLLKTIWLSMHHVIAMKHWLLQSKRLLLLRCCKDDKDWKLMHDFAKSQKSSSSSKNRLKNSCVFGYILQVIKKLKLKKHEVSTASTSVSTGSIVSIVSISLDLSRLATTLNRLERSIQIGINILVVFSILHYYFM
ncbi:hypothetical protein Tco_1144372 [Tanacetum coccineum]